MHTSRKCSTNHQNSTRNAYIGNVEHFQNWRDQIRGFKNGGTKIVNEAKIEGLKLHLSLKYKTTNFQVNSNPLKSTKHHHSYIHFYHICFQSQDK